MCNGTKDRRCASPTYKKEKTMELRVNEITLPEAPSFNYDELKTAIIEKAAEYSATVYTADQIKMAKSDRATLNRLRKALNDERIRREKEYMQPFNDFKSKVAEIIGIIDKAIVNSDKAVKAFEEQQKQDKMQQIEEFWNGCEKPFEINLGQIMDAKWLNSSFSIKQVQSCINAKLEEINTSLVTLANLAEFAFEAQAVYKDTLDLGRAIQEGKRLSEMAKAAAAAKAEAEKAATEAVAQETEEFEVARTFQPEQSTTIPEESREWVRFQAFMTVEEAKALGRYLREHGIEYKAI